MSARVLRGSTPEGVAQDAWVAAGEIHSRRSYREAIARAIMAERGRCAAAATEQTFDANEIAQSTDYGRGMDHAARTILVIIRNPTPTGA